MPYNFNPEQVISLVKGWLNDFIYDNENNSNSIKGFELHSSETHLQNEDSNSFISITPIWIYIGK
ncbi:hypothetical protein EZS27_034158 [termite gut metagenome]|uniref:Uncharacterized protein n=1 Tax=termite gut metagenome TaxID=433724 RepID=A0A5J4Q1L1_9ZZZZ